jgi:nitrate reductase gamma subunit
VNQAPTLLLFVVAPYLALVVFFFGTIRRYLRAPFTYSSLSSQFLENRRHFWALVPFHYGIVVVLTGHVVAFLLPRQVLWWNAEPLRRLVLEVSALSFGLLALVGIVGALVRRASVSKVRRVTTPLDWVVIALLAVQIAFGVSVAVLHPWGSSWFAAALAPYLWSLALFRPDTSLVTALPLLVKLHVAGAWLLIALTPFSRLVHVLVAPNPYLWRKPQVVRWYRAPGGALR